MRGGGEVERWRGREGERVLQSISVGMLVQRSSDSGVLEKRWRGSKTFENHKFG